jgi:TolB-like protein
VAPGTVFNQYELVQLLGTGGMGAVWRARDHRLDRDVALKLLQGIDATPDRVGRFLIEARAASGLNHPGIVQVYEIGDCDGVHFIAMELVEGETLGGSLLPLAEALETVAYVADALAVAHARGVVHRDIKPANLMRTADGHLKVLDFGLARRIRPGNDSGLTEAGTVMGTLEYMSPEQILGAPADHRSDLFSLGVVLCKLATGLLPYSRASYEQALAGVVSSRGAAAVSGAPDALTRLVRKATAPDPADRFQSASEMAQALREAIAARPAPPAPPAKPKAQWFRFATASFGALAAVAVGLYTFELGQASAAAPNSVAVLPFGGGAGTSESDYLREGIAESLINRLAGSGDLRVISRDASFRLRSEPAVKAGRSLRVRAVVTGAVRQLGPHLLVTAELVDARTGDSLWGGEFRGGRGDVLAIRDRIASAIAGKLEATLGAAPHPEGAGRETHDATAHDYYLRGEHHNNRLTAEDLQTSIDYFKKALEADPDYALAHAGLAESHMIRADLFLPPAQELDLARAAAERAIQADPSLAVAHAVRAMVQLYDAFDWKATENGLKLAIELDPNAARFHAWYGWVLTAQGRTDEGLDEAQKAVDLERDPSLYAMLAANLYFSGRYREAAGAAGKALDLDPEIGPALYWRALSGIELGTAWRVIGAIEAKKPTHPMALVALARAYAAANQPDKAEAIATRLEQASASTHVSPWLLASVAAALGRREAALDALEKAVEQRSRLVIFLARDPLFQKFGADPRMKAAIGRVGSR